MHQVGSGLLTGPPDTGFASVALQSTDGSGGHAVLAYNAAGFGVAASSVATAKVQPAAKLAPDTKLLSEEINSAHHRAISTSLRPVAQAGSNAHSRTCPRGALGAGALEIVRHAQRGREQLRRVSGVGEKEKRSGWHVARRRRCITML
jgi:hypothetical protein